MVAFDELQFGIYFVLLLVLTPPLGRFMARVYSGEPHFLTRVFGPVERLIYRACGVDANAEQNWKRYAAGMLAFNAVGLVVLYAILRLQHLLPLNPMKLAPMSPHLAFNTAVSFVTNTNWQSYGGESTLSYLSQMVGLTVQNFVSAATGMAVAIALVRGFARRSASGVGNFFVDCTRSTLYILLPFALVGALLLAWQGVPQNFDSYTQAHTLEGAQQTLAQGPAASQIAIKQLGTNGGGFFNVNSAHPYENPTPLSNFIECLFILLIPAALVYTFGCMVRDRRQGWALWAAMAILFIGGLVICYTSELSGNPLHAAAGVDPQAGNMEGKEVRFGVGASALWATVTTDASNGSVNSMHDSYTPLGGLVPLFNIMLGEIIYGGVGAGLYGVLMYVIIAVFIAGLMVGRTPEYLGKKIEAREVLLCMLALLVTPIGMIIFPALSAVLPSSTSSIQDAGPHGLTELLYAYTSATGNNGSAFAGFNANTPYQDTMLGIAMFLGRFVIIIPMLAVAGSMAAKKILPATSGTFPTHGPLFVVLLIAVIFIVGGLTFFPALALGPIAEHLAMLAGRTY
jgi:potassium-transporting ATPase potassium-binding subunit